MREWQADDLEAMHRWRGDPQVTRFVDWGSHTVEQSASELTLCLSDQASENRKRFFFAIEQITSRVVIGSAGFHWIDVSSADERRGEIGYFLCPPFWGHGYGTEAATLVLTLAFTECAATEILASCDAQNPASERVMQKIGLRRSESLETSGRRVYAITRAEWHGLHGSSPAE
jgi:[ribosomal protein S5]-alanine N-acetyltransferase